MEPTRQFTESDDLTGATFTCVRMAGARIVESDLTGLVVRGSEVARVDIDAPWLVHGGYFRINGVDVIGYVEAELDRRFPGRSERRAQDPEGLRSAWAAVQRTWDATLARAAALPPGAVDESVDGEWSFSQTLRHLVHANDLWVGRSALRLDEPFHPLGLGHNADTGAVVEEPSPPPYDEVLAARADRVARVTELLERVTPEQLEEPRPNPHAPDEPETVRSCLHVMLEEEWEHHRFAARDLDTLEAR